jgi:adenine C2-methylase RlmN of 23S rRNA A2503 and tRNA A37
MPKALPIREAVSSLIWANKYLDTGCEVHYALIKGENDFKTNMLKLSDLFGGTNINIKFIRLTEKASSKLKGVEFEDIKDPIPFLTDVKYEFYSPPGKDVGASCGQFLLEHYKRYKK